MEKGKPDFEAIAKQIIKHRIGEVLPHDYFKQLFNIEAPQSSDYENDQDFIHALQIAQFQYMSMMEKLTETLLKDYKTCLKNEKGIGYYILSPEDQLDYGITRTESTVKRKLKKGQSIIINIDHSKVDIKVRKNASDKIAAWSMIKQLFDKRSKTISL